MTNFDKAIEQLLKNEGGYVKAEDDTLGGETYKGVSRNNFSNWIGWKIIDSMKHQSNFPEVLELDIVLQQDVKDFYKDNFWNRINGDRINEYNIVFSIFDFAVNAGVGTSAKIAQRVVGVDDDGIIGNNSIKKINEFDPEIFVPLFIIEKVKYYIKICEKRPENKKFFFGWIRRAINN